MKKTFLCCVGLTIAVTAAAQTTKARDEGRRSE